MFSWCLHPIRLLELFLLLLFQGSLNLEGWDLRVKSHLRLTALKYFTLSKISLCGSLYLFISATEGTNFDDIRMDEQRTVICA